MSANIFPFPWPLPPAGRIAVLTAAYFIAGWLGLQIPSIGAHITLIWMPTGVAVAALLRWGEDTWPGVALGALLVNLSVGSSLALASGIALGNTLGPLFACHLLKRAGFHPAFDRQRDVGIFVGGACAGMAISATCGVINLILAGLLTAESSASAWLAWWMGDSVGVLLAAPLLLSASRRNVGKMRLAWKEVLAWYVLASLVAWFAFFQDYAKIGRSLPLAFTTLPLLAWAAVRFGLTGAALAGLAFSVAAALSTATGHGTFFLPDQHISLLLLWTYMAITVMTGLLVTALRAEQCAMEANLRTSEAKLRGLYELSPLGITLTDMQGRFLEFNPAFLHICGYSADELKQFDYWRLTAAIDLATEESQMETLQRTGHYGPFEKEYLRKDGTLIPLQLNGMLLRGSDGEQYIWSIVEDISKRKAAEAKIHNLAFHDPLTHLPNRRLLRDRLGVALPASARQDCYGAVLFLDLDNFKNINDSQGHEAGDWLLTEVARRLNACVRTEDTVARIGGDEFVIALENLSRESDEARQQSLAIADKIQQALADTFFWQGAEHRCSTSIGISLFKGSTHSIDELLNQADAAMYEAKAAGRNAIRVSPQIGAAKAVG